MLASMGASSYSDIKVSLRSLYLEDTRPWLVGFSGGKDSTMLASLIIEVVAGIPEDQRKKPVAILCTDTRVEIPAIAEMVEGTLAPHPALLPAEQPEHRSQPAQTATRGLFLGQHDWPRLPATQPHLPLVHPAHED